MTGEGCVLVTGAAGFIGGALARAIAPRRLVLLDRAPARPDPGAAARVVTGDLAAITSLLGRDEPPEVVYHCAGITAAACEADPEAAYAVNVGGTRALLAWCAGLPRPPRLVFASTVALFGSGERVVTEASRVAPASTYGATKAMAEQLVLDGARRGTADAIVVRLPVTIVRPGRTGRPGAGFLSDLILHAAAGRPFEAPLPADRAIPAASLRDAVRTLLRLGSEPPGGTRLRHVPSLAATADAVLAALAAHGIAPRAGAMTFRPDGAVERLVAGWPERLASLQAPEPEPLDSILGEWLRARDAPLTSSSA